MGEEFAKGEKIYTSFRMSRRSPHLIKYYIIFIIFVILGIGAFFSLYKLPGEAIAGFSVRIIATSFLLGLGILVFVYGELKRLSLWHCTITNYRIVVDWGVIRKHFDSVSYNMIVNVRAYESVFEKIFGVGKIDITTARGHQEIVLNGVADYNTIENLIYRLLERRQARGR